MEHLLQSDCIRVIIMLPAESFGFAEQGDFTMPNKPTSTSTWKSDLPGFILATIGAILVVVAQAWLGL